jgi:hypothetical protein
MRNEKYTKETLKKESMEILMLMSVPAQAPYRGHAIKELQRRKVARSKALTADAFMLLI